MKKKLIPILCFVFLFCFTSCSMKKDYPFEYDKSVMVNMTKNLITNENRNGYLDMDEAREEYLLSEGENIDKTAVAGFRQARTTDKVGTFTGFNTSEDNVTIEPGAGDDILCSIIVKFSERDVKVTISYKENKIFNVQYSDQIKNLESYAKAKGYASADELIKNSDEFKQLGYRTTSAKEFITDYLVYNQTNPILPYTPVECEVSAVYSTSELLVNGAKNMGVGMGVVFSVLIFIACIIYLLRFVPKLLGKPVNGSSSKKSKGSEKPAAKPEIPRTAAKVPDIPVPVAEPAVIEVGEEVTDGELIAVITAALHSYLAETSAAGPAGPVHPPAYTASNDKLIVRSIRRVR